MPSMINSLSGKLPEKAPRLDLSGTEAPCGVEVFVAFLAIWEYLGIYRPKNRVRRPAGDPQARAPPPLGRALQACGLQEGALPPTPSLLGFFWSKKNHSGDFILFVLHLIFLICKTQTHGNNRNWHWALD